MHDLLDSHSALATEMNAALGIEKSYKSKWIWTKLQKIATCCDIIKNAIIGYSTVN